MTLLRSFLAVAGLLAAGFTLQAEGPWMTDYDAALEKAEAEGKVVFANFSGSDWCYWCQKLDSEVLGDPAFLRYAEENLILLLVDFPRDKSGQSRELQLANEQLQRKYGIRGFPTVLLLDGEGKVIERTGYQQGGPDNYVAHIDSLLPEEEAPAEAEVSAGEEA